jgi:hypothetical protein
MDNRLGFQAKVKVVTLRLVELYIMKIYLGVEIQVHTFLTSAHYGSECVGSGSCCFSPKEVASIFSE